MHTLAQLQSGQLTGIHRLDLSCGLSEFPREIFTLAPSLEVLNLSGNALQSLPDDLHRLQHLKVLFCSDNRFTELPESLGRCNALEMVGFKANLITRVPPAALPARLRWLILTDNEVSELPDELGSCHRLQKLMLAGNRLQRLPDALAGCHRLELLRIASNRFDALPPWLVHLPALSWLAYADNPLGTGSETAALDQPPAGAAEDRIAWPDLHLHDTLGEGASGIIHRATWQRAPGRAQPVALKLFKGAVTSDGSPQSEMAACLAAGAHPNLIAALGRVEGHPDGAEGLVMPLIDAAFSNLAGPPSLESCTRDTYPADRRFTLPGALQIARGIASAMRHLHARGILHGDLYAHNILWNGRDQALLGDFGAASFMPRDDPAAAAALAALEVRAFACLLEELISRCDVAPSDGALLEALGDLQQRCAHEAAAARPSFVEIHDTLLVLCADSEMSA